MKDKLTTAKAALQKLIDHTSRIENSNISTSHDSYHNWLFQCNTETQKIFGSQSPQCKSIFNLSDVSNALNYSNTDAESGKLRLSEISKKKIVLQEILNSIGTNDILDRYLMEELPTLEKISKIQKLIDDADMALATGKILNPQYSIWHDKALDCLRECFDVSAPQVTAFSSNTFGVGVVDQVMQRDRKNEAEKKLQIQRKFLQEQLTVLEKIAERSNHYLSQSNTKNTEGVTTVTNNINIEGNVNNSAIAAGDGNTQSLSITQEQRAGLEQFLKQARTNLPNLSLDSDSKSDYNDHLSVIEGSLTDENMQPEVVKKELRGLKRIAEGAAGSAIGGAATTAIIEGINAVSLLF